MRDLEGEVAVVGEEDQSFGVVVETADGIDALAHALDQIDDRAATLRVFDGSHHFLRFVQEEVAMRFRFGDELPVDFDVIDAGSGFRPELGDDAAVHRHPPFPDHRLGFPARREARVRDDLLQSLEFHHSSVVELLRGDSS
jgi:hypothetical protein